MADIYAAIRTKTLADGTVSGLVGTRLYSDALPQNATMPAIVCDVIDSIPNEHLVGIVDLSRARMQFDCFADTRTGANALADAVRLALEQQRDLTTTPVIREISLQSGPFDRIDRPEGGKDARRYISTIDFFVFYQATTS